MKAAVVSSVIGIFGINENGEIIDQEIFPKDAYEAARKLFDIEQGKIIPEIRRLVERLKKKNYRSFFFENPEMVRAVKEELNVDAEARNLVELTASLRENLGKVGVELGFVKTPPEIMRWIRDVAIELSRLKVKRATEKRDLLVIQAIEALDDLDRTLNLFMSRLREWYGIHFPELSRLMDKHETYAKFVYIFGRRENFSIDRLRKEGIPKDKATRIVRSAKSSMGADLEDSDIEYLRRFSKNILQLYEARANLDKYIDSLMEEIAPNIKALAGPTLGARLIALAGGLENLAKMPASTVQVLGAEKALFRSLTTGSKPPKHGIIFQHSLIFRAKRYLRGKIARALAGKLAIAARTDAFTGNYIGDKLKEDLERRVKEIMEKYPAPKPKKPVKKRKKSKRKKSRRKR